MCNRSKQVIPGLIRKINRLEAEVQKFRVEEELKGIRGDDGLRAFGDDGLILKGSVRSKNCRCVKLFAVIVLVGMIVFLVNA